MIAVAKKSPAPAISECRACGMEFYVAPRGRNRNKPRKFCSRGCWYSTLRKWYGNICPTCGKSFGSKVKFRRYCSRVCASRSLSRVAIGKAGGAATAAQRSALALLECAPNRADDLARWFKRLSIVQLNAVWPAAIAEAFGEGKRAIMLAALMEVRKRFPCVPPEPQLPSFGPADIERALARAFAEGERMGRTPPAP